MNQINILSRAKKALAILGLAMSFSIISEAQSTISGTVFKDENRNTIIDAGENFLNLPAPMYVYLVNSANDIIDSAHVSANGSYTVDAINNANYTLHLSAQQYNIGTNINTSPINHTPPTGFTTTGENASGSNTGNGDYIPDGIIQYITVWTTNLPARNFGIACSRTGADETHDYCANDAGIMMPLSQLFSWNNPSDRGGTWSFQSGSGIVFNSGIDSFELTNSATNSILRYDIVGVSGCPSSHSIITINIRPVPVVNRSVTICAGDSVCVANAAGSQKTLGFNQKVCYTTAGVYSDTLKYAEAQYGCDSIVITTLTVNTCGTLSISGNVFNDANNNKIIDGGEGFSSLPAPLYIYLINSDNIVVDSAHVNPDGSYTVQGDPNKTFTLKLSTLEYPLGTKTIPTPINTAPPTGWVTTGENGNNNTGSGDGTPDGSLIVTTGSTSVDNQNFGIAESGSVPVDLLSFSVFKTHIGVQLDWATAQEQNNKGFEIERSPNGIIWNNIGWVNSQVLNGNNNTKLEYSYTDKSPLNGSNYYRLKQIDFDNNYEYSSVRTVKINTDVISLVPNPVNDYITISNLSGKSNISIFDMSGRIVFEMQSFESIVNIDLSSLTEGVYNIRINNNAGRTSIHKFLKVND